MSIQKTPAANASPEKKVFIARQPIYNSSMGVFGYELLFRTSRYGNRFIQPTEATAQVLASTIIDFGLEKLVHHRKAVVNVTPAFIEVMPEIQLPPEQIVVDIPNNMQADEKLLANLKNLRKLGYGVSVGGFQTLKDKKLLSLATIYRIDVKIVPLDKLDELIKYLRHFDNLSIQALKIENMEEFHIYRDKGIEYLQGFFLGKPRVYTSSELSANKLAILHLLSTIYDYETPVDELENQISHDLSLSYKLLKLVNSTYFGVAQKVDSIKRAVVILGRDEIRKWVSLLALNQMSDEPAAMMEITMLRARLCELLAEKAGLKTDSYFTVGMFSTLDILMKQPLKSVISRLPLSDEIKAAILDKEGTMGKALQCAIAIENANWSEIDFADLSPDDISDVYNEAIEWTDNVLRHY